MAGSNDKLNLTGATAFLQSKLQSTAEMTRNASSSRLGDELRLLYSSYDVAESSLASILDDRWDGTGFVP